MPDLRFQQRIHLIAFGPFLALFTARLRPSAPAPIDGRDLTATPLDERRDALATVLKGSRLLRSEPLPGAAEQIEKAVRELHLEGVVAKGEAQDRGRGVVGEVDARWAVAPSRVHRRAR